MAEYFWAGLLVGLLIWTVAEVSCQLFQRKKGRAGAFVLVPVEGDGEDLEYILRRARGQLSVGDFSSGRILVVDRGMSAAARQVALRFEGVRLCTEKELGPVVAGLLPGGKR